ncbi:asparaginase [Bordetella sp. N]|uniref:asparaginase n=1 Tax=Bordetella sp. N TaxID=1746199 RepID=UPI0007089950|nr:asparaginase [Bordetella sp. N]ALM83521.1 L-asparaginase [Bordetella sp. N]
MAIALITTGGTIVSERAATSGLAAPTLGGEALLASIAAFGPAGERPQVQVFDSFRVPSPLIGLEEWRRLHALTQEVLERPDIEGAVVTHGTSTLEETAWFLDLTLDTVKPVVLTGAQRNASEPDSDGPRNLFNALTICAAMAARRIQGVVVALNDSIHAAREVTKSQTLNVETFNSGVWGSLGHVRAGRVIFHREPLRRLHLALLPDELPSVFIVPMYVGAGGELIEAAVARGARGIVVQGIASGHVNAAMHDALVDALDAGVSVVLATRIPSGGTRVGYSFKGSSHTLVSKGAVLSDDLSPWKARILLMLALQNGLRCPQALGRLFADDEVPVSSVDAPS